MSQIGIVILCYGNICRSPIGDILMQEEVRKAGLEDQYRVSSAGFWRNGEPAHANSIQVMKRRGLDLTQHQSQILTPMKILHNHILLAMEEKLADQARALGAEIVYNLTSYASYAKDNSPIDDPIGQNIEVFEDCAKRLEHWIPLAFERIRSEKFERSA